MKTKKLIIIFFLLSLISCSQNMKKDQVSEVDEMSAAEEDALFDASEVHEVKETVAVKEDEIDKTESKEYAEYEVLAGDTLMLIAYKVYGDYQRWPEIYQLNKTGLSNKTTLEKGQKLRFVSEDFNKVENPQGLPYLIKPRDTLTKISNKVYGKVSFWDEVYFNNKEFIKNPNMLYSGFVIFYPKEEQMPQVQLAMSETKFDANKKLRLPASSKK